MKLFASLLASAAVLAGSAMAQPVGNENDLQLTHDVDVVFFYASPNSGGPVDTITLAPPPGGIETTNDHVWRVVPASTIRQCGGTMEIVAIDVLWFDTDYTTLEGANNTSLCDFAFTRGIGSTFNPTQISPDWNDPNGIAFSFGPGAPFNNAFLPDPGCPPAGFVTGYELDIDLTGGAGAGFGIPIVADGTTDYVWTVFIPAGSIGILAGGGACGLGDSILADSHATALAGAAIGESQPDFNGTGYSPFGGWNGFVAGGVDQVDAPSEAMWWITQFSDRTIQINTDNNPAHLEFCTQVAWPESGLGGINMSVSAGTSSVGHQYYSHQGIGNNAAVVLNVGPPIYPACVPLAQGTGLGLNPLDPFFNLYLGLPAGIGLGLIAASDCENTIPGAGDAFEDGTWTPGSFGAPGAPALQLGPIPAAAVGFSLKCQGLEQRPNGSLVASQVSGTTFWP